MGSEVTVTIEGYAAHGKSTVAEILRQALKEKGIACIINDDNGYGRGPDEAPGVIAETLPARIESVKEASVVVRINTLVKRV